jgi:hypothetical protein
MIAMTTNSSTKVKANRLRIPKFIASFLNPEINRCNRTWLARLAKMTKQAGNASFFRWLAGFT